MAQTSEFNQRVKKSPSFSFPSNKIFFSLLLLLQAGVVFAQDGSSEGFLEDNLGAIALTVLVVTLVIVIFVVTVVSDRLLQITASRVRGDQDSDAPSTIIPSTKELLPNTDKTELTGGVAPHVLKRGFDIKVAGRALKKVEELRSPTYAVKPKDLMGMTPIPKLEVEVGDEVKAGDKLFYDKKRPEIFYTAPVSGEVAAVNRAEKRSIAEVVILADDEVKFKDFGITDPTVISRDKVIAKMLESGTWPYLRQRPYNVVADPNDVPRDIFISTFDSAPMAPNYNFTLAGEGKAFQAGINALRKLTDGDVHLGMDANRKPADVFMKATGVEKHWFKGAHPAGNVGVQIHHVKPIKKGEIVWHIGPQEVVVLGRLFSQGKYDTRKLIALGGPVVKDPKYYSTYQGASVKALVEGKLNNDHVRYISGNVLTGTEISISDGPEQHIGFYDNQVSVVEEGDFYEMFGWILPSYARPSISPTFPWSLFPDEEFDVNTNTHGEERAFVVTGEYEKVLPMDIYPVHLLKAIMARDFDKMEGLGIYEVIEEDLALCEFVCTSKVHVQGILRDGLDYMREQA